MPFGLRGPEIIIILVLVLLLFGAKRLPEMAKGIGQSVREFRKGIKDIRDDIESDDEPKKVDAPKAEVVTPAPTTNAEVVTEKTS